MPQLTKNELRELVDAPNETLDAEYKEWLDLVGNHVARADLARHIAALSNYGGGVIVLGISDSMQFAGPNPFSKIDYNRDLVASIVKRYLEPPLQCDVQTVRSAAGNDHPIIIVPAHGAAPICAKANGPEFNGRPQGIVQGCYYTRKPTPESAPILTSSEWAPVIRRCAMHERSAILSAIDAALRGPRSAPPTLMSELTKWHDSVRPIYLEDIRKRSLPPFFSTAYFQFSYAIERVNGQTLDPDGLIEIVRQVNAEVRDLVFTGWSMFHPFAGPDAPYFSTDAASGLGENDFLECALLRSNNPATFATDMWRVSADGKATIIRAYLEDDVTFTPQTRLAQGTWFSPHFMVSDLAEIVRHARGMAERFDEVTGVSFRCEWHGLENRILHDPVGPFFREYRARRDHRITTVTAAIGALGNDLDEIVARLGQPVVRLFTNDFVVAPNWVKGQHGRWLS